MTMPKNNKPIDQKNTELDAIKNIRSQMSGTQKLAQYFSPEIAWLNQREKQWLSSPFRIGLIGITSSGKSTLVNALLGEKILPEAVRPSSNNLVVCEWGQAVEAVVYFHSRTKKPHIIPIQEIAGSLKSYADEESNRGNIKGVEEIRIRSPRFRLGHGIVLIDTPGLDAHGHDDHEKLTLEVLLPTVDAIIFLTTCKANSDKKIKEYVAMAHHHDKPVMVVQNMIDSVVEKLGAHGQIIENKNQVLGQHLRRLQSVLKEVEGDAVSIIQCSAKWALQGTPRERASSGLDALVAGVQAHREMLAPRVSMGRRTQITRWLKDIVRKEQWSDDPYQRAQNLISEFKSLQHQSTKLSTRYAQIEKQLLSAQQAATLKAAELCTAAETLNSRSVDDAYTLKSSIERWLRESPAALSTLNKLLQTQVSDDCKSLNLRIADIDLSSRLWQSTSTLAFETQEKQRGTRSQQSGAWGWFKRKVDVFDNNWGYDEGITRWTEITDLDAFRASIHSVTDSEKNQIAKFVTAAVQRVHTTRNQFIAEIERQQRGISQKQDAVADDVERKTAVQHLTRMVNSEYSATHEKPDPTASSIRAARIDEKWHDMEVAPVTLALTELARLIARHRFPEMRDRILSSSGRTTGKQRALIVSFDQDSLGAFINRFWFDHLEADHGQPVSFAALQLDSNPFSEIGVACFSDTPGERTIGATQGFLQSPCVIFLVLDIQQIGATESMLSRSMLLSAHGQNRIVLVVQSIRELENSDSIAEALRELQKLAQRHKLKVSGVLVNDEDITNSKLAHWLLTSENDSHSITEEMQLLKELFKELPDDARKRATEIVSTWKERKHTTA